MNSKELLNRAWQYDIVGMLGFVLSNTSNTDFGRIFFMLFGVGMILASLGVMLYAYKKSVREQEAAERIIKEIAEMVVGDNKKGHKKPQKAARKAGRPKKANTTTTKPDKA